MEVLYINDTVPYTKKRIVGSYGIYDNEKTERSLIFYGGSLPTLNLTVCCATALRTFTINSKTEDTMSPAMLLK